MNLRWRMPDMAAFTSNRAVPPKPASISPELWSSSSASGPLIEPDKVRSELAKLNVSN